MNSSWVRHFAKFNVVGAMGVVVQLAALDLFIRILDFSVLFATGAAVETAVLHNFIWHERFTWADRGLGFGFRDSGNFCGDRVSRNLVRTRRSSRNPTPQPRNPSVIRRFLLFNLTNGAVSLVGNLILMDFLMNQARLPLLAANLASIGCCALLNFVVSDRWVFRSKGC